MEAADDLTLARQVTDGDETAIEAFYARYADSLFAFIYHHIDESHPDAEDVWQDTLLAAISAAHTTSFIGYSQLDDRPGHGRERMTRLAPCLLSSVFCLLYSVSCVPHPAPHQFTSSASLSGSLGNGACGSA